MCSCLMLVLDSLVVIFFYRQKTAYELRISDWSSDVCSSDLPSDLHERLFGVRPAHRSERLQDPRQCVEPGLSVRLHRLAIGPTDALAVTPPRRREEHVGDLRDGRVRLTVDIMPRGQRPQHTVVRVPEHLQHVADRKST